MTDRDDNGAALKILKRLIEHETQFGVYDVAGITEGEFEQYCSVELRQILIDATTLIYGFKD